jgi:ubiquinone/menaquinone biosynthesis C-methylase UbiE
VLDMACGTGVLPDALAQKRQADVDILASDFSDE